ncbi:MAG TPA: hypothetical protein ENF94_01460 [Candidatus Woesearchaeota archaeon]|nr:hypothetical protein [Candidatus Woesearchaeota archaeon]
MKFEPRRWPKEVWMAVFVVLLAFYFLTINKLPENATGFFSVGNDQRCEWSYLTDEFPAKEALALDLNDFFMGCDEYAVFSDDGKVFRKDNLIVFFPNKKKSLITIVAKNKANSVTKAVKVTKVKE